MTTKRKSKFLVKCEADLAEQAEQAERASKRKSKVGELPEAKKDLHSMIYMMHHDGSWHVGCTCEWNMGIGYHGEREGMALRATLLFGIHVLQAVSSDIQQNMEKQSIEMIGVEPMGWQPRGRNSTREDLRFAAEAKRKGKPIFMRSERY